MAKLPLELFSSLFILFLHSLPASIDSLSRLFYLCLFDFPFFDWNLNFILYPLTRVKVKRSLFNHPRVSAHELENSSKNFFYLHGQGHLDQSVASFTLIVDIKQASLSGPASEFEVKNTLKPQNSPVSRVLPS